MFTHGLTTNSLNSAKYGYNNQTNNKLSSQIGQMLNATNTINDFKSGQNGGQRLSQIIKLITTL